MEEKPFEVGFLRFGGRPEYWDVNRRIMRWWFGLRNRTPKALQLLDLGSGIGFALQLLREVWQGEISMVTCVDTSMEYLEEGKRQLSRLFDPAETALSFIRGKMEEVALPVGVDFITALNCIHYVPREKLADFFSRVRQSLIFGGEFLLCTSFYTEVLTEDISALERALRDEAAHILHEAGEVRNRQAPKSPTRDFRSTKEYLLTLEEAGLKIQGVQECVVDIPEEGYFAIAHDPDYVAGVLHGHNPEKAMEALRQAVKPAFQKYGKPFVPRKWLAIVASVP